MAVLRFCSDAMWLAFFCASVSTAFGGPAPGASAIEGDRRVELEAIRVLPSAGSLKAFNCALFEEEEFRRADVQVLFEDGLFLAVECDNACAFALPLVSVAVGRSDAAWSVGGTGTVSGDAVAGRMDDLGRFA